MHTLGERDRSLTLACSLSFAESLTSEVADSSDNTEFSLVIPRNVSEELSSWARDNGGELAGNLIWTGAVAMVGAAGGGRTDDPSRAIPSQLSDLSLLPLLATSS